MTEFLRVASVSDLQPGEKMRVAYGDEDVGLFNIEGAFFAISDVCTHDYGPLVDGELEGDEIECPRHGARFNVRTGEETPPAYEPVPCYEVRVEGDDILISPREW